MNLLRYLTITLVLALIAAGVVACDPSQLTIKPVAPTEELPVHNELISTVDQLARPELYETPWDAAPNPDGDIVYFTASGPFGSGVYQVTPAEGETTELWVGEPFTMPLGLAVSSDGEQIYVADPQATSADGQTGQIFVVALDGSEPMPLAGTEGTAPRGLEVVNEDGADMIYFSGISAEDGEPAVMKIAAEGGAPTVLAQGAPLVEPSGIAVTHNGEIYVVDILAGGNGLAAVFQLDGSELTTIADDFRTGADVAGATLLLDDSALLVSALARDEDSAQVLVITLPALDKMIVNKVIGMNQGSGGVHRAQNANYFAWADVTRGKKPGGEQQSQNGGGVYGLQP